MIFLLDQGLPRSAVKFLLDSGMEAEHVGVLGLANASDNRILSVGRERGAVIVTLDSDFHSILALSNASTPSVIRIRIEGLKGEALAKIIIDVSAVAHDDLAVGAAVTVTERRIAVKRLPLIDKPRDESS
jgi:predicted nuclease of predicted toxin-antitoxin system